MRGLGRGPSQRVADVVVPRLPSTPRTAPRPRRPLPLPVGPGHSQLRPGGPDRLLPRLSGLRRLLQSPPDTTQAQLGRRESGP